VWRYADTQDIATTPTQSGLGSLGSVYDIFFSQFESVEPDPIKRASLVDAYLLANGLNPRASVIGGFLTSALTVQRRQSLSLALLGLRSSVTLLATRTLTSRLDTISTALDDLSRTSELQQQGFNVILSHRLTPQNSVTASLSTQNTADSAGATDNNLASGSIGWSSRLGQRSSASVNVRRAVQSSRTAPYDETAITGTWNLQF
jgi:uncharacterized protein (PEP-CTERM system associated)